MLLPMSSGRKSLFLLLMRLAWNCRYSMPLLLTGTAALLGHAWMFQIRVDTVRTYRENELGAYFEGMDDYDDELTADEGTWDTDTDDSWETIVESVAYG